MPDLYDPDLLRARLQDAATPTDLTSDPAQLRAKLQGYRAGPNPRLTTPQQGPLEATPAQELRARLLRSQPNPRLTTPFVGPPEDFGVKPGPLPADFGKPPATATPAPTLADSGGGIRQWFNDRFATPGAQTPGDVARGALDASKRAAQGVGDAAGQTVSRLNAGGVLTGVGRGLGAAEAAMGVNQAINDPNLVQGRPWLHPVNADAFDRTVQGAATVLNPGLGAIGNLARAGRDFLLGQGVDLAYGDRTAGPALKQTLAGRTPEQYLAQRQAAPAASEPSPKIVTQDELLALMSPEDRKVMAAQIRANPLQQGGIQYRKDGQMYLASLQPPNDAAATPATGGGRVASASSGTSQATARQGGSGGLPRLVSNENETGYQLLYPDGRREDTVQVMYGADGGYIQSMDPAGYKIPYGRDEAPNQAVERFFKQKVVGDQINDKLAAGEPVPTELIKSYYLAHGLDPKDILRDEASIQGHQIQAGAMVQGHQIQAQAARDVETSRAEAAKNRYMADEVETGQVDPITGKPFTIRRLYDTQTQQYVQPQKAKTYPAPSPASIEQLSKNAGNSAVIQEFESRYGPGSAAQYLPAKAAPKKPAGYAKGGLVKRYAQGGAVEGDDYQWYERPEDHALRAAQSAAAASSFGSPSVSFDANAGFGRQTPIEDDRFSYAKGGPIKRYSVGGEVRLSAGDLASQEIEGQNAIDLANAQSRNRMAEWDQQHPKNVPLRFAQGGPIAAHAQGRQIKGPGTGTSDSIPALIDGQQPAAISTDEYIIPADVVRHVGVKKLDAFVAANQPKARR